MKNLDEIRKAIVATGSITAADVHDIRDIVYTDGKVEKSEAEFLFALKKELNDFGNLRAWNDFFIEAICDYILGTDRSCKTINADVAMWLTEQIGADNVIDDVELKLLKKLRNAVPDFPSCLVEIIGHSSNIRSVGRKIFLFLCKNSRTMRSMEYGVSKTGNRKASVRQIIKKHQ